MGPPVFFKSPRKANCSIRSKTATCDRSTPPFFRQAVEGRRGRVSHAIYRRGKARGGWTRRQDQVDCRRRWTSDARRQSSKRPAGAKRASLPSLAVPPGPPTFRDASRQNARGSLCRRSVSVAVLLYASALVVSSRGSSYACLRRAPTFDSSTIPPRAAANGQTWP